MFRVIHRRHRPGLAADLLQALFCGLPRLNSRMAVFVAASDESEGATQDGPFLYGGFIAPVREWTDWFAPAWEERVLQGPPTLPFFHMAESRSRRWRKLYGLTDLQAEDRTDEAVRLIATSGHLYPVIAKLDGGHFRRAFKNDRIVMSRRQPGSYAMEPDHAAFMAFVCLALEHVEHSFPDADKVDFVVERKSRVTQHIPQVLEATGRMLSTLGHGSRARLIGDLIPAGKERVPLQAADVLLWHLRRYEANHHNDLDTRRLAEMMDGRRHSDASLSVDAMNAVRLASADIRIPSPFAPKRSVKRVVSEEAS